MMPSAQVWMNVELAVLIEHYTAKFKVFIAQIAKTDHGDLTRI
jgi:hypothetical protein